MPSIEVFPEQLLGAGSRQAAMANELRQVRSRLNVVRDAATGGAGEAAAAQSMATCCEAWSGSLGALADAVEGYGSNLTAAGSAYSGTDSAAMPTGAGAG